MKLPEVIKLFFASILPIVVGILGVTTFPYPANYIAPALIALALIGTLIWWKKYSGQSDLNVKTGETERIVQASDLGQHKLDHRDYVFSTLNRTERINLFEEWKGLSAKYEIPDYDALPIEEQDKRNEELPIDLSDINSLLDYLNLSEYKLTFPTTNSEYKKIRACKNDAVAKASDRINNIQNGVDIDMKTELRAKLDSVYKYLAKEDLMPGTADLAVVPGCRSHWRADKAGDLYREGKVRKIYLTGGKPFYDKSPEPHLSEALAMEIYLSDIKLPDSSIRSDIYIDTNAIETEQNITYSKDSLFKERSQLGRPLTTVIVTSPYHMRRTRLMVGQLEEKFPHLIKAVYGICASSPYMENNWFESQAGVNAYFTEYWKLHGGRVVGEF